MILRFVKWMASKSFWQPVRRFLYEELRKEGGFGWPEKEAFTREVLPEITKAVSQAGFTTSTGTARSLRRAVDLP